MFGIGINEIIVIAIVALLVIGPARMPETLRTVGRGIGSFRKVTTDLRKEVGFDEVVNEVARPLREGMLSAELGTAGLKDLLRVDQDLAAAGTASPGTQPGPAVPHNLIDVNVAFDGRSEYPAEGPDDCGALPENAEVYPPATRETVAREAVPPETAGVA